MTDQSNINDKIVEAFKAFDSASISDAMDRLGITGTLPGIKSVVPGTKLCGPAFTVHYVPCGETKGTVGDFIDDVKPGEVVVIDNGGRTDCTVWGDIMSLYASKHAFAGTIIDGVCRDVPTIRELNYPIFTKGTFMRTGKDRVFVDRINETISISSIQVVPGDLMFADDSGALVIPRSRVEEILEITKEIEAKEQLIRDRILAGTPLKAARKEMGYHNLQTRR